jgi:hypothetical protein
LVLLYIIITGIKIMPAKSRAQSKEEFNMLNMHNIDSLIVAEEESYLADVISDDTGICQMSSADAPLADICERSELNELSEYLSERGIEFWLIDEPKTNPTRKYRIWISRTKGNHPQWGLTPVDKDEETNHHERKHRS